MGKFHRLFDCYIRLPQVAPVAISSWDRGKMVRIPRSTTKAGEPRPWRFVRLHPALRDNSQWCGARSKLWRWLHRRYLDENASFTFSLQTCNQFFRRKVSATCPLAVALGSWAVTGVSVACSRLRRLSTRASVKCLLPSADTLA